MPRVARFWDASSRFGQLPLSGGGLNFRSTCPASCTISELGPRCGEAPGTDLNPPREFLRSDSVFARSVDRSAALLPGESPILDVWSATLSATWKAAENDCLERRNSIRPCVPSHVAYKAERGGNELFWSPWKMYPRSQERRRNREATVYLPALGGDGPRLDRTIRIYKCSQASSAEESLKCCAALLAVSTEA